MRGRQSLWSGNVVTLRASRDPGNGCMWVGTGAKVEVQDLMRRGGMTTGRPDQLKQWSPALVARPLPPETGEGKKEEEARRASLEEGGTHIVIPNTAISSNLPPIIGGCERTALTSPLSICYSITFSPTILHPPSPTVNAPYASIAYYIGK